MTSRTNKNVFCVEILQYTKAVAAKHRSRLVFAQDNANMDEFLFKFSMGMIQ
jgi:hypothetical protein